MQIKLSELVEALDNTDVNTRYYYYLPEERIVLKEDDDFDEKELIPMNPSMKPFEIVIFFSGLERSLTGSRYNMRVDELKAAAYSLAAYAGFEYGRFVETCARDIPEEVYLQYRDQLPETFKRRADH